MMVCDHWFMVDCKTSQLYYAANERIGVKNQPFISSGEKITREFGTLFHHWFSRHLYFFFQFQIHFTLLNWKAELRAERSRHR